MSIRSIKNAGGCDRTYGDITQHEIEALKIDYNLADAHTHQSQSETQREIIARLPALWYESERTKQYDMEQKFIRTFFLAQNKHRALEPNNNALLVYASSIAMAITAIYLRQKSLSVSLIEPCFDNIHDLLKHEHVPMQPLQEEWLADEAEVYRNLETHVTSDAVFVVDPNNPTGFTVSANKGKAFAELVRFCKDRNKILILDFCFAAFMIGGGDPDLSDPYELLEENGVSYIAIEDTGKTWPLQDTKAALLKCSRDLYADIYAIHTSYLLNVSPFILNLLSCYVEDSVKDGFASVNDLLERNREIAKRELKGSLLEYQEPRAKVSVAWFKIADPDITATELHKAIREEGAYVLPGTYFYWSDHGRGERYIRVALARDTAIFEPAIKVVRAAVDKVQRRAATAMKGLWVPLVTPMRGGRFDAQSMRRLIETTDAHVDGYAVGLTSGEGEKLSDSLLKEAIACATAATKRPVAAGILGREPRDIVRLSKLAEGLGCASVVIPARGATDAEIVSFFTDLARDIALPIVIYNTESAAIGSIKALDELDRLGNIVAIKDSSSDARLFERMLRAKPQLRMAVLQGMEDRLGSSAGCNGYLVSLANIEPALCRAMFDHPSEALNREVLRKFEEYNLASGEWFVTLKALLYGRGVLSSAEQVASTKAARKVLFDSSVHMGQFCTDDEATRIACKNSQIAISMKPEAAVVGVVSFNENSWTDHLVWALERETQDVFYKFMDTFHTVKNIERVSLSTEDAKRAVEFSETFALEISNALTCALAVAHGAREIHTRYPSLLRSDIVRYLEDEHDIRLVEISDSLERAYDDPDLEGYYQDALAAFRAKSINPAEVPHG